MIDRRTFNVGLLAAAGAVAMPTRPSAKGTAHRLVAKQGQAILVDHGPPPTPIWGYDGKVPGPELRAPQGAPFAVDLVNALPQPTTAHWHGIRIVNAMDGVANLTQAPVPPGETFAYRFTPPDAGTYWYHPHSRTWEQMARGLYGALVVEEPEPPNVDVDRVLIFDDWRLDDDGRIDAQSFGALHDKAHAGRLGNVLTLNGQPTQDLNVLSGQRLRLRLLNASNARVLGIRFEGHATVVIALDGQPVEPHLANANTISLAPSQRADVIIDADREPGERLPVHVDTGRETLRIGDIVYAASRRTRAKALSDLFVLPANPMPKDLDLDDAQPVDLVMDGGAMGGMRSARYRGRDYDLRELAHRHGKVWAFNGEAGMTEQPLARFHIGRTAVVRMVNRTAWPHAMHVHGHHVREVSHSARRPEPYWRDTVLLGPRETVAVAFKAHNPGRWMLHCHMLEHQAGGMATWYEVG